MPLAVRAAGASTLMLVPGRQFLLATDRLRIVSMRSVNEDHVASLNNQRHMRYSEQRRLAHSIITQKRFIERASPDFWVLDLQQKQPNMPVSVGSMTCTIDRANRVVDLGVMITTRCTKQGFAYEAFAAMTDFFLSELGGMEKVEAGCDETHVAMRKILVRLMAYEGMRPLHFLHDDGKRTGVCYYGRKKPAS